MLKRTGEAYDIKAVEAHNAEIERLEEQDKKPTGGRSRYEGHKQKGQRKRIINRVAFNEDSFNFISSKASSLGIPIEPFVASLAEWAIANGVEETQYFRQKQLGIKLMARIEDEEKARRGAAELAVTKSPDLSDLLAEYCEEFGLSADELVSSAKDDPMSESLALLRGDPDNKRNRCIKWMMSYVKLMGNNINAREANSAARQQGFNKKDVIDARDHIGILSVQDKDGKWVWEYPVRKQKANVILGLEEDENNQ